MLSGGDGQGQSEAATGENNKNNSYKSQQYQVLCKNVQPGPQGCISELK